MLTGIGRVGCCVVLWAAAGAAQTQQYADLGDFRLESGEVIRNCRVGYRTHGKLNAERSNAILWPTWFTGRTADLEQYAGPGKMLDDSKYFVVFVDALGDGVSSSPSTSREQPRMHFPQFTIRDMVNSQHQLLTEKLGIPHVRAVMGISMGGMQTFEWMVAYPGFMDCAIPIVGTPRLGTSDVLLWSAEAEAIRGNKEWNGGDYSTQPKMLAVEYLHQFALETPGRRNSEAAPEQARAFVAEKAKAAGSFDANDWLRQLEAMLAQDVYRGRPLEETAKTVKARVLVIVAAQDHMVSPDEALRFTRALGRDPVILSGNCGHMATSCEADRVTAAVRGFLE